MISIHIKLEKFITCDRCKTREHDTGYVHSTALKITAKAELPPNWVQLGEEVFCPECLEEI
jgi:hypothetical protein